MTAIGKPEEPPSPYGPFHEPVDRFAHLMPETREWLEQLREKDILLLRNLYELDEDTQKWLKNLRKRDLDRIDKSADFYDKATTVSKVNVVIIGAVVTMFITGVTFGESILKVLGWKHP